VDYSKWSKDERFLSSGVRASVFLETAPERGFSGLVREEPGTIDTKMSDLIED
jgi:hypothetical protein